jgi:hypothetical protein
MTSILPLSVTVSGRRRACILDADLALSRFGLLLASRICEEFDVWLVREFWEILDSTESYLKNPERLMPSLPCRQESLAEEQVRDALRDVFEQWETWRLESDLAGLKFYWIGDAMRESLIPKGVDQNLLHRYQVLARSLDFRIALKSSPQAGGPKAHDPESRPYDTFTECFRDAAALAAALAHHQGFILTQTGRSKGSEPPICSYLNRWGIACSRVERERKARLEMECIVPLLGRSGVYELIWAGLPLAAVHLVVPKATIIPPDRKEGSVFEEDFAMVEHGDLGCSDWWKAAVGFWYPLGFD